MRWQVSAILVVILALLTGRASAQIVHPGVAHSKQDIEFVKKQVSEKQEPWFTAWERLRQSSSASLDYQPTPYEQVERGPYNNPDRGSSEFSKDGKAAYVHALIWAISGDDAHAKKSAEILNAWSSKFRKLSHHDARLLAGISGYHYCVAAELLKHTWDGWAEKDQAQFARMLSGILYPLIKDFYPSANGNWDASMMQLLIAMGVHLDDQQMIDKCVEYFKNGVGNGAIGNYFNELGQCQESGRDQGHTQMGLDFLSCTCETAWIQGIDLYREKDNRLLKGFEYTAKYNLGEEVPFERFPSYQGRYDYRKISDDDRGRLRPMYEKVLRHYQHRRKTDAPYTQKAAYSIREKLKRRTRTNFLIDILMFAPSRSN